MVASAKPGQIVELPEGTLQGGATLPDGVSLKGAGYGKTLIDAKGCENGIVIKGGNGATVSGLTVRGAKGAGVAVLGGNSAKISRVRASGCATGFVVGKSDKVLIENCIADRNNYGIIINGGSECTVVNCTTSDCVEMGISLAATKNAVLFNNCIAGSGICLNIDNPANVQSDSNLFFGLFVGQMADQPSKKVLSGWQVVTALDDKKGLDLHSLQSPVQFKDPNSGDFAPTTVTTWALDRAVTGEGGVADFAGAKAPKADINGKSRVGRVDIGAVETTVEAPRPADGELTIAKDDGVKSAGVFTKDGMLVAYLFQNLPLSAGKYSFWLPARDYCGRTIAAGDYDVRMVESDLKLTYIDHVGDNRGIRYGAYTASANPKFVAFADKNTMVMQQGESEDHIWLRGFDTVSGEIKWFTYGVTAAQGLAIKDGVVYTLIRYGNQSRLTRVNAATGAVMPWEGSKTGHLMLDLGKDAQSMAALGKNLYVADAKANKLDVIAIADGKLQAPVNVPSPKCIAADDKNNLLWVISGDSLIAIDATGKQVAACKAVEDPASVSVCAGKLAVASHKTGKVYFFDAAKPAQLKPTGEMGKGDGPYGKVQPDRFFFQKALGWGTQSDDLEVSIAVNSDGQLAVTDANRRVSVFAKDGKNLWYTYGVFGNQSRPSYSTGNRRLWDPAQSTSFLMDEKAGTWQIEALWDFSAMPNAVRERWVQPLGDFTLGGKTFFAVVGPAFARPQGSTVPILMISRLDGYKAVPVLAVSKEGDKLIARKDTNKDGKITAEDTALAMSLPERLAGAGKDAWGQQLAAFGFQRFNDLLADGSILTMNKPAYMWKCTGLDADGVPVYEAKNFAPLPNKDWDKTISPYDFKPDGLGIFVQVGLLSDGGYVGQTILRSSGGCGLNNGGGTDLSGYGADGRLRWVNQMAQYHGIAGMGTVDDITVTAIYYSMDVLAVDADGMGLGGFCEPAKLHYCGYWIDHPNVRLFKMPDGNIYMTNGDNTSGRHNWYRLDNVKSISKSRAPLTVTPKRAAELAAITVKQGPAPVVPQPQLRIPRLAGPMKIDGDLKKWRDAGVAPQITIGPSGNVKSAADASAIIRIAYEGNNLYFQVLSFDDKPVFGNWPVLQNSVELAINGVVPSGMQFVAGKREGGVDVVWRNRFFDNNVKQGDLPH